MSARIHERGGSSIIVVLVVSAVLSALGLAVAARLRVSHENLVRSLQGDDARYVARAGLELVCVQVLRSRATWADLSGNDDLAAQPFSDGCGFDVHFQNLGQADLARVVVTGHTPLASRTLEFTLSRAGLGAPIRIAGMEDHALERWAGMRGAP